MIERSTAPEKADSAHSTRSLVIRRALETDMDGFRALVREYVGGLGLDLSFQGLEEELASLPGPYAEPWGSILVAGGERLCGCVAFKKIGEGVCEMKRLYVRDNCKGQGIGKMLVAGIIEEARNRGYLSMRLDTLSSMKAALHLYRSMGFEEIGPYVFNPLPDAVYMEKKL